MKNLLFLIALILLTSCGRTSTPDPTRAVLQTFTPVPITATPLPPQPIPTQQVEPTAPMAAQAPTIESILVATDTPQPTQPTQAPPTTTINSATTNDVANLRSGPGTDFAIVSSVSAGQSITITGRNPGGDWYQLSDGTWIAAFLVTGAPIDVAMVDASVVALPETEQKSTGENPQGIEVRQDTPVAAPQLEPIAQPFTCGNGCAMPPDPSCDIKGNFNGNNGDKIYHRNGGRWYDDTDIILEEGDVWFCTAAEAEAAGYREAGQ